MTVSVVIPVKDDAERLAVCLRALRRQTVLPSEIVVVDNASTDDSAAVAKDGGARVVRENRPGIPAAASAGYDAAHGDIILRLDADTIPSPTWIEAAVTALARRPRVGAVTGGATFSGGPRWLRGVGAAVYLGAYYVALTPALGHVPLFGSNFAMRREAWHTAAFAVHRRDPELHDDLDLAFHLGSRRRIRYAPGMMVQISHRPMTDASSMVKRFRRGFRTVFVHWPHDLPWLRWARSVWGRLGHGTSKVPGAPGSLGSPGSRGSRGSPGSLGGVRPAGLVAVERPPARSRR
ncbi:glycosyltransferase family 2 protein [Herbiconiux sp. P15]|uniref:glycosyltransferase family 2 protein n=1 Tax=Herbiconiux liukaitaii TaxID=3342799 RepID=UPI0035BB90A5